MKKTGLAYIVQFRRQNGAEWGPVEKFAPPHAQIWGLTPNFKILFYGSPGPLQILKISRENLNPFLRKFFFQNFGENLIILELGELLSISEFKKIQASSPPIGGPNLVTWRF